MDCTAPRMTRNECFGCNICVERHFKYKLNFYYILNPNKIKQLKNGETHFPFFTLVFVYEWHHDTIISLDYFEILLFSPVIWYE